MPVSPMRRNSYRRQYDRERLERLYALEAHSEQEHTPKRRIVVEAVAWVALIAILVALLCRA